MTGSLSSDVSDDAISNAHRACSNAVDIMIFEEEAEACNSDNGMSA